MAYSMIMTIGHICCDMNTGAVPALLPFLVTQREIDYAAAAGLMFASSFLSSLVQPLLGMLADRKQRTWLIGVGILMTGTGIAAVGFCGSYAGVFIAIMFAGLGSAIFHPEGARIANYVSGEEKGRGMSNFTLGGTTGFILGPIVVIYVVSAWGLKGTSLLLLPAVVVTAVFFVMRKKIDEMSKPPQDGNLDRIDTDAPKDDWPAFLKLSVSVFTRSIVITGIQVFIPLYWMGVLMQTQEQGSFMITVMAVSSAATAFLGGRLADRHGFCRVTQIASAAMCPLVVLILLTKNVWIATAAAALLAGMPSMGHVPSVVLGQKYLPNRLGLASGVTLGLSGSIGGMCSPVLGGIGDAYGLTTSMVVIAGVALACFLGTLLIKDPVPDTVMSGAS